MNDMLREAGATIEEAPVVVEPTYEEMWVFTIFPGGASQYGSASSVDMHCHDFENTVNGYYLKDKESKVIGWVPHTTPWTRHKTFKEVY